MRAFFDETVPMVDGDFAYVVVATLLIADHSVNIKHAARSIIGKRSRGFHWIDEGSAIRQAAITCLIELGACAHVVVHHPTARRSQERARKAALERLLPLVIEDGATELLIESRGEPPDTQDRITLMSILSTLERQEITYDWYDKGTPELWLPDAACGAVGAFLNRTEPWWYEQLVKAKVITEPIYITSS
jgi:hypothetical protein